MSSLHILIVEDEENLGQTLQEYLSSKGHSCSLAASVSQAKQLFNDGPRFQVVLMDVGLPDGNGIELAQQLRQQRKDFVLLFLSAQNDPETRLAGLTLGAEDYISKPFDLRELTLRLERILATSAVIARQNKVIQLGPLAIHFDQYEVVDARGERIPLAQKECAILEMLYERQGQVVSREEILDQVWGAGAYPTNRTVDNYMVKLRKWTDTSDGRVRISSIRGIGYKLEF